MRKLAIETDLMARNYGGFVNPFWVRFKTEIRKMLADKAKPTQGKNSITEEVLFIGNELLEGKNLPTKVLDVRQRVKDWIWYVTDRVCPTGRVNTVSKLPEEELLKELQEDPIDGLKQVILIYGHTGHGKTTFLRHFFYDWLSKHCGQAFKRHIVIRISMGLGGFGKDIENDFDKKVNRALNALFPWLFTPEHLFQVAKHFHRNNPINIDYLEENFPRDAMLYDMITWINKFNNSCTPYIEDDRSHDFNRLLTEYLVAKYDIDLIFIMDNVDQSPASLQGNFYILARHKLDWITSIDKVVFILGVRGYLLEKVYKESVVQAYPTPARIRIFPPPVFSYLSARIKSFANLLTNKRYDMTMHDGKVINVPREGLIRMLNSFNTNYSDPNNDIIMSRLTNHDMRQQSKIIEACLRSQSIDWAKFINIISLGKTKVRFSQHDIMRAVLHDSNAVVAVTPEQSLINIFTCGSGSNFSNSLNRWYILKILSESDRMTDYLIDLMEQLGHPRCATTKSIEKLLLANIITSPDGFRLREDRIRHLTLSDERSTLGSMYLSLLPFNLRYVESMAYLTPLDDDLVSKMPIPHSSYGPTFPEYVRATAVLVRQIKRDEKAQEQYIQLDTNLVEIAESNGLLGFGDKVCARLLDTLKAFKTQKVVVHNDWPRLFSYFK